jgi:Fe-Mn family superoxide dismutase
MDFKRRNFLKAAGTAGSAIIGSGLIGPSVLSAQSQGKEPLGRVTHHELRPLHYSYRDLEPHIDFETMETHHTKHHFGYIKNLNNAEGQLAEARAKNDYRLIQHWSRQVAFNYGGHYLHTMFWDVMAPDYNGGGGEPDKFLKRYLEINFGTVEAFKAQFSAAALAVEGSGWALLHYRPQDQRLMILQAENQHKFAQWGATPIMGIDVWEHAYYLKYRNRRADYIKAWWNVVNWEGVKSNLLKLIKI